MNRMKTIFGAVIISVLALSSCGGNTKINREVKIPAFPYQAYLDSLEAQEDEVFPTIGDDGNGFNAISHKIRYPEMPDTLSLSHFASLVFELGSMPFRIHEAAFCEVRRNGSRISLIVIPERFIESRASAYSSPKSGSVMYLSAVPTS